MKMWHEIMMLLGLVHEAKRARDDMARAGRQLSDAVHRHAETTQLRDGMAGRLNEAARHVRDD